MLVLIMMAKGKHENIFPYIYHYGMEKSRFYLAEDVHTITLKRIEL